MARLLPLLVVLSACATTAWQDPPRAMQTLCDDAGARTNIGPEARLDARPRPECRPSAAAPSR